ncbi:MAG: hypothetical protein ACM3PP_04115 [Candidatus Saccharibacteria bacterium]
MKKRLFPIIILVTVFLLMFSLPAMAWVDKTQKGPNANGDIVIGSNEVIDDDVFIAGKNIEISGTINGDVLIFAQKVDVKGKINGDLVVACENLSVSGVIYDDLRQASQITNIEGRVLGGITSACNQFNIVDKAQVLGNVTVACQNMYNKGTVYGSLTMAGESLDINGLVGKNVKSAGALLTLGENARIGGDLQYRSTQKMTADPHAKVAGKTDYIKVEVNHATPKPVKETVQDKIISFFVWLVAAMLVWAIWRYSYPDSIEKMHRSLELSLPASLGWGIILLIIVPIASIIMFCTVVGIPISLITLGFYFLLLYVSKIVVGFRLGEIVLQSIGKYRVDQPAVTALIGIFLLMLLGVIPIIGPIVKLVVFCLGLGSMFIAIREGIAVRQTEV